MSEYDSMIKPVRDIVGVDLELWDTGGGCTALQAFLEGDVHIIVTDSPYSTEGHEAHITGERERRLLGERNVGYSVGVYREEGSTNVLMIDAPQAEILDLPFLIKFALDAAIRLSKAA